MPFIHSDLKEKFNNGTVDFITRDDHSYQTEGQHLYKRDRFNVTSGLGHYDVESDFDDVRFPPPYSFNITQSRGYSYFNARFPDQVIWTAGISYDYFRDDESEDSFEVNQVNPKFGVQWNVTDALRFRGAVFRTLKPALVNSRTLEPTQIAGFNQFFDDLNATKSWRYGAGLDWQMTKDIFAGAELTWRELDEPVLVFADPFDEFQGRNQFEQSDEQLHRSYLYWTPLPQVALSAELIYDRYHADQGLATEGGLPRKVETLSVPLAIRYFHHNGLFAGAGATYVNQQVRRSESDHDDFVVVDALVGYRFPKRFGIASLEINNLFDTGVHYQDDSFRYFREDPMISR